MLGLSSSISLNELHRAKPYGDSSGGRSIYANDKLQQTLKGLQRQASGSDHKSFHATTVINAVNRLRAGILPANTFLKNGTANRYCVVHSGFEIEYMVGTPTSQTDIVIVNIRLVEQSAEDKERAGLWKVKTQNGVWGARSWHSEIQAWPDSGRDYRNRLRVGINGYCRDIRHAAGMLPSHIARGAQSELSELKENGYQLFYVPAAGNLFKAGWQSLGQMSKVRSSRNDVDAARILAAHMLEAHEKKLYVEWVSHRGGSFVLTEAMKFLSRVAHGQPVNLEERQTVFFSDPTSSLVEADHARRAVNTYTNERQWYNGNRSNLAFGVGAQDLGIAPLACSFNAISDQTGPQKVAAYSVWGMGAAGAGYGLYVTGAAMISAGAGAAMGIGGLVVAVNAVLNSIPSLNEDYHVEKFQGAKILIEKLAKKVSA